MANEEMQGARGALTIALKHVQPNAGRADIYGALHHQWQHEMTTLYTVECTSSDARELAKLFRERNDIISSKLIVTWHGPQEL